MSISSRVTAAAPAIAVVIAAIGLAIYLLGGVLAIFFRTEPLYGVLIDNPAANIGIPCSAFAAFVIVATLWKAHPPRDKDGQLQIKFFNLEFTGPAGPIGLWVVCFLALILAIDQLRLERPIAGSQPNAASQGSDNELK